MMIGFASFAQSANTVTDISKKNCVPSQECADKMGMTLEECKAVCAKICGSKATTDVSNADAKLVSTEGQSKQSCSKSKMTNVSKDGESQVASAIVVSDVSEEDAKTSTENKAKTCSKSSKACCKKKQ